MKPAPFRYVAPRSVEEALSVLADEGDGARVLAGGQSLGPLLNLRIATPTMLVDANRIAGLDQIESTEDGALSIAAMVRQRAAELSPRVSAASPMLVEAIGQIGHRAIRNRGTIGGSVAHADPAAELPAVLVALQASIHLGSAGRGMRTVPASEFFLGPFMPALDADEMLVNIEVPSRRPGEGQAWMEVSRRHGDFAIVGVAAVLRLDPQGSIAAARLVYSGVGWAPFEALIASDSMVGEEPGVALFAEAAAAAAAASDPPEDVHATTSHRRRLVDVLTRRALARALSNAGGAP